MREAIPIHLTQFDRIIPPVMNHFHGGISITLLFYVLFAKLDHHDRFYVRNDALGAASIGTFLSRSNNTGQFCVNTRYLHFTLARTSRVKYTTPLSDPFILPNFCVIIVQMRVPYTNVNHGLSQHPLHHATQQSTIPTKFYKNQPKLPTISFPETSSVYPKLARSSETPVSVPGTPFLLAPPTNETRLLLVYN